MTTVVTGLMLLCLAWGWRVMRRSMSEEQQQRVLRTLGPVERYQGRYF